MSGDASSDRGASLRRGGLPAVVHRSLVRSNFGQGQEFGKMVPWTYHPRARSICSAITVCRSPHRDWRSCAPCPDAPTAPPMKSPRPSVVRSGRSHDRPSTTPSGSWPTRASSGASSQPDRSLVTRTVSPTTITIWCAGCAVVPTTSTVRSVILRVSQPPTTPDSRSTRPRSCTGDGVPTADRIFKRRPGAETDTLPSAPAPQDPTTGSHMTTDVTGGRK